MFGWPSGGKSAWSKTTLISRGLATPDRGGDENREGDEADLAPVGLEQARDARDQPLR